MLALVAKYVKDISVLRRLLFAVAQLPPDLPNKWGIAVEFATQGKEKRNQISPEQVKVFVENIHELDFTAFQSDDVILQDLVRVQVRPWASIRLLVQLFILLSTQLNEYVTYI